MTEQETTKKITLVLDEIIKRQNSIEKELSGILKGSKEAQESLKKLNNVLKGSGDTSDKSAKQNKKLNQTVDELTKSQKNLKEELKDTEKALGKTINIKAQWKKVTDGLFTSLNSISSALKITAAAFTGLGVKAFNDSGSALLAFAKNSIDGSKSIDRLTASYQRLGGTLGQSNVSLLNAAKTLGEFQSKGLADSFVSMNPEISEGILRIKDLLLESFTEDDASKIMQNFQGAFEGQFDTMLDVTRSFGKDMNKIMSSIQSRNMDDAQKRIEKLIKTLSQKISFGLADPKQLQPLFTALDILNDKAAGKKTSLEAISNWNNLVNTIKKALEDLSSDFYMIFGEDLASAIGSARDYIKQLMADFKKFKDAGGLNEYINKLKDGFKWLVDNSSKIVTNISAALKEVYNWFQRIISGNADWKDYAIGVGTAYLFLPGISSMINGIVGLTIGAIGATGGWTKSIGLLGGQFSKLWGSLKIGSGLLKVLGTGFAAFAGYEIGDALASGLAKAFGASEELQKSLGRVGSVAGAIAGGFAMGGPIGAGIAGLVAATKVFADIWSETTKRVQEANQKIDETTAKIKEQIAIQSASDPSANLKSRVASLNAEIEKTGVELENSWWPKWMQQEKVAHIEKMRNEILKLQGQINDKSLDTTIDAKYKSTGLPVEEYDRVNELTKKNIELISKINQGTESERSEIQKKISDINKEIEATKQLGAEKIEIEKINSRIIYTQNKLANSKDQSDQTTLLNELNRLQDLLIKGKEKLNSTKASLISDEDNQKQLNDLIKSYKELNDQKGKVQIGGDSENIDSYNRKLDETNKKLSEVKNRLDMAKASDSLKKLADDVDRLAAANQKLSGSVFESRAMFESIVETVKAYSNRSEAAANISNLLADAIGSMGPNFALAGQSADDFIKTFTESNVQQSIDGIVKASEAVNQLRFENLKIETQIEKARNENNTSLVDELNKTKAANLISQRDLYEQINKSVKANASASEKIVAKERERAKMVELIRNLSQEDLRISQTLYGTPALAVQSQLKIAQALEQQKQALIIANEKQSEFISNRQKELNAIKSQIDLAQSQGKTDADVADLQQKRTLLEGTIWSAQKNQLQTQTEIKRITSDQLETVKQLRDGYLDAVHAQAFSAGRFEKIIVTREKNASMALEKNMAKRNFLLGQIQKDAMAFDAESYQFSASGLGALQRPGGGGVNPEDITNRVQQAIQNVNDPTQKAAIEESLKIISGIHQQAAYTQREIAGTYSESANAQVDALNNNTSAINSYAGQAHQRAATAVALKDNDVVAGEAAKQAVEKFPRTVIGVKEDKVQAPKNVKVTENNKKSGKEINISMPKLEAIDVPKNVKRQTEIPVQSSGLKLDHNMAMALVGQPNEEDQKNIEKARVANAKIYQQGQTDIAIKNFKREITEGMRKHYEGLDKMREMKNQTPQEKIDKLLKSFPVYKGSTINVDTNQVQKNSEQGTAHQPTKTSTITVSNNSISGGDSWSGKFKTVARILEEAGPIIDELISAETGVTNSRHPGLRGGQSFTNNG